MNDTTRNLLISIIDEILQLSLSKCFRLKYSYTDKDCSTKGDCCDPYKYSGSKGSLSERRVDHNEDFYNAQTKHSNDSFFNNQTDDLMLAFNDEQTDESHLAFNDEQADESHLAFDDGQTGDSHLAFDNEQTDESHLAFDDGQTGDSHLAFDDEQTDESHLAFDDGQTGDSHLAFDDGQTDESHLVFDDGQTGDSHLAFDDEETDGSIQEDLDVKEDFSQTGKLEDSTYDEFSREIYFGNQEDSSYQETGGPSLSLVSLFEDLSLGSIIRLVTNSGDVIEGRLIDFNERYAYVILLVTSSSLPTGEVNYVDVLKVESVAFVG